MDIFKPFTLSIFILLPGIVAAFALNPFSRKGLRSKAPSLNVIIQSESAECLIGKNAIVTGASSGLGKSLAIQLAHANVRHLVLSGRNLEALQETKSECEKIMNSSNTVHVLPADLSNLELAGKFAEEALEVCGSVDMLVLSGGISSRSSFLDTSLSVDELLMKVNFLSGCAITKKLVPGMVENGKGSIVWISSLQGLIGTPFRTSYAASKHAVQGYCEALRSELASSGIKVHCISPGYINTNLSKSAIKGDGSKHGKLDEATASGANSDDVAVEIFDSLLIKNKSDLVVAATASARAAIALKMIAPKFIEKKLMQRYLKALKDQAK